MSKHRKKIGLVLGGGGARGWAHIGVIRAIQEARIPIHCVAGTSMGALVGGAFVCGKIDLLQKVAIDLDWKHVFHYVIEFSPHRSGLIDGSKIVKFVRRHITSTNIEDASIPLQVVATNIQTGQEVVISQGDIIDAIRASVSIPGIFTPVVKRDLVLVDGGLVNPVPVSVVKAMGADFVIAVDVNRGLTEHTAAIKRGTIHTRPNVNPHQTEAGTHKIIDRINERINHAHLRSLSPVRRWISRRSTPNVFDIMGNTIRIIETELSAMLLEKTPPDILIQPQVGQINFMEFHRAQEAIDAGYEAAHQLLANISEAAENGKQNTRESNAT